MNPRFVRITIGLLGLALVTLSWVLMQPVLWSRPALSSMYGLYTFGLTSLG
jgi:predicted small integral membrane protein